MQHITGIARNQMVFTSLEDSISEDNSVRFVDAFVENIDLKALGFELQMLKTEGRPSFSTQTFLKIYLYGYLNGLRSSRKLEKECVRNIELQWLLFGLVPNYHSISDFRKNNPSGLKKLFKVFVSFLKDADLIAGETIAIDGTKSRAHNSKKANFNQKKIDKHLAYIEEKTQQYLDELAQNDEKENSVTITKIQEKIERLKNLPIILPFEKQIHDVIEKIVISIIQRKADSDDNDDIVCLEQQIDNLVYRLYDLTYDEVKVVDPEFGLTEEEYNRIEIE